MTKTNIIMITLAVFLGIVTIFSVKVKWNDINTVLNYNATRMLITKMHSDTSIPQESSDTGLEDDSGWE